MGGDPGGAVQHAGLVRRAGHPQPIVWTVGDFLYRITEPALRPIRNFLPNMGGLDISPIILILLVWVAQEVLRRVYFAVVFGQVQGLLW